MKFATETNRILKMYTTATLYKNTPLTENGVIRLTPKGAVINTLLLSVVGIYAHFNKNYFIEYSVESNESKDIVLTKSMYSVLRKAFKLEEAISVAIDGDELVFTSDRTVYREALTTVSTERIGQSKIGYNEDLGLHLPTEEFTLLASATFQADDLNTLLNTERYVFTFDGRVLEIHMSDIGTLVKRFLPLSIIKKPEKKVKIIADGDMVRRILANVTGNTTITFGVLGNELDVLIFESKTNEFVQTFMIAGLFGDETPRTTADTVAEESVIVSETDVETSATDLSELDEKEFEEMLNEVEE